MTRNEFFGIVLGATVVAPIAKVLGKEEKYLFNQAILQERIKFLQADLVDTGRCAYTVSKNGMIHVPVDSPEFRWLNNYCSGKQDIKAYKRKLGLE